MGGCSLHPQSRQGYVSSCLIWRLLTVGTALNEAKVEIRIQFKDVTQGIFKDISRNELVIRIQPSEAVYLKLNAKTPGLHTRAVPVDMDLTYKRRFGEVTIPEAYEALILDAMKGDHGNFVRDDELDVAWKVRHVLFVGLPRLIGNRSSLRFCTGSRVRTAHDPTPSRTPTDREAQKNWRPSSPSMGSDDRRKCSTCFWSAGLTSTD